MKRNERAGRATGERERDAHECNRCSKRAARSASGTPALQYALSMALQHAAHSGSVLIALSDATVRLVGSTLEAAGPQPRPYKLPLIACCEENIPASTWAMPREKKSAREGSREELGEPALVAVAVAVRAEALGAVLAAIVPEAVPREVIELERDMLQEGRLPLVSDAAGFAHCCCEKADCSRCHPTRAARRVGCSGSRTPPYALRIKELRLWHCVCLLMSQVLLLMLVWLVRLQAGKCWK